MFGQQMHVDGNKASSIREVDGFRISLIVEKTDGEPITQEEVQIILTNNIMTMFTQRVTFGGRPR